MKTSPEIEKGIHHRQLNNVSHIQGWNEGDLKHLMRDDSSFDKIVRAICHWQASTYAELCSIYLLRDM